MNACRLRGVVPPVATPLTPERDVDTASLERLLDHLLGAGVDGAFVLGSTGEATALTDAQRRTVIDTAVRHVSGQVPVLAGVIDTSTARVASHAMEAAKLGADGIVATAPFYAATHPAEIENHFRGIAAAAELPLYAYDIPARVNGTKLPAETMLALGADGIIAGVKDSSGSDAGIRHLLLGAKTAGLTDFSVLTGSELTVDSALAMGADGVVPGLGNVDPHGYVRLYEHFQNGDTAAVRAEQERLFTLFDIIRAGSRSRMSDGAAALGAFKAALHLLGVIDCGITAPPSVPLNAEEIEHVRGRLVAAGLSPADTGDR